MFYIYDKRTYLKIVKVFDSFEGAKNYIHSVYKTEHHNDFVILTEAVAPNEL